MKKTGKFLFITLIAILCTAAFVACGGQGGSGGREPIYLGMEIQSLTSVSSPARTSNSQGNEDEGNNGKGKQKGDTTAPSVIDQEDPFSGEIEQPVAIEEKIESSLGIIVSDHIEYYAEQNEDIYIVVRLSNPDSFVILSFTLNGYTYQSYQFEYGSDSEKLILKRNVGTAAGFVAYTIDEIKYIEGTDIKNVRLEGSQTIKAGVRTGGQVSAQITGETTALNEIAFTAYLTDTYGLIGKSEGYAKAVLYNGREIIGEQTLEAGENSVSFKGLKPNTKYQYAVFAFYDNLSGNPAGATMNLLKKNALFTRAVVLFDEDNIIIGKDSIRFDFVWDDSLSDKTFISVDLYNNGAKLRTLTENTAGNLLSDNEYEIRASYKNSGEETETIHLFVFTLANAVPAAAVNNIIPSQNGVTFGISVTDTDSLGEITAIELYKGDEKIDSLGDLTVRTFNVLLSGTAYQIKVVYSYDLNDGNGPKTLVVLENFVTLRKAAPVLTINNASSIEDGITFGINVTDSDGVGEVTAIELYKGAVKILELTDLTKRTFSGLDSFTAYQIRVTCTYDLNDGNGPRTLTASKDIQTLADIGILSAQVLNTSAISLGETVFVEAALSNPKAVKISKIRINGVDYIPDSASTATRIRISMIIDESFEGGITNFEFEKLYYLIGGAEYSIGLAENNIAQGFINGELYVDSLKITDASYHEVKFTPNGQTYHYYITLKNKTGYRIDSVTVSYGVWGDYNNVYNSGQITKIDDNHFAVAVTAGTTGWYYCQVASITYFNENLGAKTKVVSGIETAVYVVKNPAEVEIRTASDLKNMNSGGIYKLMNDINLSGMEWQPAPFDGVFDGNGYSVKNMRVIKTFENQDAELGLFSTASGVIKNLKIEDALFMVTLESTGQSAGRIYAGILAASCESLDLSNVQVIDGAISVISNGSAYGGSVVAGGLIGGATWGGYSVNLSNCSVTGNISATGYTTENVVYAGGLFGFGCFRGSVSNCYTTGDISAVSYAFNAYAGGLAGRLETDKVLKCYATGNVSAVSFSSYTSYAGGLIGMNHNSAVIDSYSTGNASGEVAGGLAGFSANSASYVLLRSHDARIENCYATGNVNGITIGGLIGSNQGYIINCYATGNITVASGSYGQSGGLVGYDYEGTIINCYRYEGQKVQGAYQNKAGKLCTRAQLNSPAFYTGLLGWDDTVWDFEQLDFINGKYPVLL